MIDFSGVIGGLNSQLGAIALGYDPKDEVVVLWYGNSRQDNSTTEIEFPFDETGRPVVLRQGVVTNLPKAYARKALSEGAKMHVVGSLDD